MLKALRSSPRFFGQAALVSLFSFINLLLSLGIQVYLAQRFGLSQELDAYFLALAVPSFIIMTIYGAFPLAFVPVFRNVAAKKSDEVSSLLSTVWWSWVGISSVLSLIVWVLAPSLARVLTLGSPELADLTRQLLQLGAPIILVQGLSQVLLAFHTSQNRFALAQATHPLATLVVIGCLYFFLPKYGVAILMISWVVAYLMQDVVLLLTLPRGVGWHWESRLTSLQIFWANLWPLALGAMIYKGNFLYDRFVAAFLPAGEITTISYAYRLLTALVVLLSSGVSLVTLPMSSDALLAGKQKAGELLNWSLRALLLLAIPAAAGIILLGEDAVRLLFERGAFDPQATQQVSQALIAYTGALVALVIGGQITNVFYAQHDSRTVVGVNLVTTCLYWGLLAVLGTTWGATGIAVSYSLVASLTAVWLMAILWLRHFPLQLGKLFLSLSRMLLASVIMSLLILVVKSLIPDNLLGLTLLVLIGAGTYGLVLMILKAPELRFLRTAKE